MEKKAYPTPQVCVVTIGITTLLAGTTETLRFNPNEGTDEALSRRSRSHDWDEE